MPPLGGRVYLAASSLPCHLASLALAACSFQSRSASTFKSLIEPFKVGLGLLAPQVVLIVHQETYQPREDLPLDKSAESLPRYVEGLKVERVITVKDSIPVGIPVDPGWYILL